MKRLYCCLLCIGLAATFIAPAVCDIPALPSDPAPRPAFARSLADQAEIVLIGYRDRSATATDLPRSFFTAQKAEPVYGCYIGVNCFRDDNVDGSFPAFCARTGKKHAMVFDYAKPGDIDARMHICPDPLDGSDPNGPFLQSAFEPEDLSAVVPGAELDNWARALASVERPVFLRWGSEMNGNWVPWGGKPALYKEKWRLVHDTMARLAPNVVMVWCPNATPALTIDDYYPGDNYVDWVGVNFYVVTIHDGDKRVSARHENPADLFKHVYAKYSARKPIMICETGVTHKAQGANSTELDFAVARVGQLYGCLPRLYPRVKAICYYDIDNIKYAQANRCLNNYLVTENRDVLKAYSRAIAPDYFLSREQKPGDALPDYIEPLADGQTLVGTVTLSAWAKSLVIAPTVQYRLDGKLLGTSCACGSDEFQFDTTTVMPGPHVLSLAMLYDCSSKVLKTVSYNIKVGKAPEPPPAPVTPPAPVVSPAVPATTGAGAAARAAH